MFYMVEQWDDANRIFYNVALFSTIEGAEEYIKKQAPAFAKEAFCITGYEVDRPL